MKIKTITCHNVYNFGASLQAYALMTYLSMKGHEVEIINYIPSYIKKNLSLWAIGPRWSKNIFVKFAFYCYVVPIRLSQYKLRRKFDMFTKRYLKLTPIYNSFEELKVNPPKADIYMCGSDQIWNTCINNGLDPAYYVDFAPQGTIRASYAASFSISEIPFEHVKFVQMELEKLDFISVRENTAIKILHSLNIEKGITVVDPVFLLSKEHWFEWYINLLIRIIYWFMTKKIVLL